jgi:hypothetical protein
MINKKTVFGPEGAFIVRNNPDGTPATPSRILGFYGTVDLSSIGATNARLGVKIDNGVEEINTVDWAAAVDPTAVTVAEMVTAITNAAFTNITVSQDTYTDRLLIVHDTPASVDFLQVFSVDTDPTFAALLDFGQGQDFGGNGIVFFEAFDNLKTVALPKNIKAKEEIETESGDGTIISVILNAIIKGYTPVLTMTDDDYYIKEVVQGGTWAPLTNEYTPPLSSVTTSPIFSIYYFGPQYGKGTNQRGTKAGYLMKKIYSVTGLEADESHETKTLKETAYNCDATEWTDECGVRQPFYTDKIYTTDEFDALDVESIQASMEDDT